MLAEISLVNCTRCVSSLVHFSNSISSSVCYWDKKLKISTIFLVVCFSERVSAEGEGGIVKGLTPRATGVLLCKREKWFIASKAVHPEFRENCGGGAEELNHALTVPVYHRFYLQFTEYVQGCEAGRAKQNTHSPFPSNLTCLLILTPYIPLKKETIRKEREIEVIIMVLSWRHVHFDFTHHLCTHWFLWFQKRTFIHFGPITLEL